MWHLAKSHTLAYEVCAYIYIYIYIDCYRTLLVISSSYKATIINYTHTSIIINQLKKKNFGGILWNKSWYKMCLSLFP